MALRKKNNLIRTSFSHLKSTKLAVVSLPCGPICKRRDTPRLPAADACQLQSSASFSALNPPAPPHQSVPWPPPAVAATGDSLPGSDSDHLQSSPSAALSPRRASTSSVKSPPLLPPSLGPPTRPFGWTGWGFLSQTRGGESLE